MMEKNDITFSLHLTLDGKEHLVTAAAAAKEVQRCRPVAHGVQFVHKYLPPPRHSSCKRVRVLLPPSYTFYA